METIIASPWTWLITGLVFVLLEMLVAGFYLLPMGLAALGAACASLIVTFMMAERGWWNVVMPPTAFMVFSIVLFVYGRPWMLRFMYDSRAEFNTNALIGQQALVVETIDPTIRKGAARIGGEVWAATTLDSSVIPENTVVTVTAINGNRAVVQSDGPKRERTT